MKNLIIFGCIGIACFTLFKGPSTEVPFPQTVISENTGVKDVLDSQKLRVVLFTGTDWCGACQVLDRQVIGTKRWKEFTDKEIRFTSYDIPADQSQTSERARSLMSEYGVRAFPTMVILNSDFKKIDQFVGAGAPVENFKKWIRDHES